MTTSGYRQVDHTADLALELWGATEGELLQAGGQAIIALLTDNAAVTAADHRTVRLETVDAEDRLVRWLSEVLYLASVEGFVLARAELRLEAGALLADLWGQADARDTVRTEIKAVTYHDLTLRFVDGQVRATVVLDV